MRVPPSTPSMTYSSHSGRDRSSGRAWIRQTTSASCSRRARRRHGVVADVEVDVEVGVLDPVRQVEAERHLDEPPAERRQLVDALEDDLLGRLDPGAAGRALGVEDRHRRDVAEDRVGLHVEEADVHPRELLHRRDRTSLAEVVSMPHAADRWHGTVHEAGDGCLAYVQRDGAWGWSNAGLIVGDGRSLLVDTLFDLRLTAAMLEALAPHTTRAPIDVVVNTHANGDHCYGNELVAGAEIIASAAAAEEMAEVPPAMLAALNSGARRGRRPVPQLLRRLPVRRHRADAADAHVRRAPDGRRRRPGGRADRGRPGAHEGRHDRPRARRADGLHRRHPVHRRHADRVGRPAGATGSPRAT